MRPPAPRGRCLGLVALLSIPLATGAAQDSVRSVATVVATSRVIGRVTDSVGVALPRAEVGIFKLDRFHVITNDSGEFRLDDLPAGPTTFTVRRLGYEAATFSGVLKGGKVHRVSFALNPIAEGLPGVTVEEKRSAGTWLSLFETRRSGSRGTFITRKQIEQLQARTTADVLRTVPGVQIANGRFGSVPVMTRGSGARRCVPQLYVHTTPYSGGIDDFTADDIEAMEIYVGISELPADLNTSGRPICAAIVIWTREPPPKGGKRESAAARGRGI
jgi:hypothetical protein